MGRSRSRNVIADESPSSLYCPCLLYAMGWTKRPPRYCRPVPQCANVLVLNHQCAVPMSRLTITLSEARYRALKEASAQRNKTIGQLIDESLDFYGIKSRESALELVRRARGRAKLTESEALSVAQEETNAVRRKP